MLPFEIRYLSVDWSDPETVLKLETSQQPVEVRNTSNGWQAETTTFPKAHGYIGISITEGDLEHEPYFLLAGGQREALMPLREPGTDKVWWIQHGEWHKGSKRYLCELYRTSGRVDLFIQHQRLTIENNTSSFSVKELEHYLADFKNSLWMLIIDNSSVAKAGVMNQAPDIFSQDALHLFHEFINHVEKIVQSPSMVLSETQGKLPVRSVKPVPRTFREHATRPNQRELTSRKYIESYDTPENRFIHYTVKRANYLLKSLGRLSGSQSEYLETRLEEDKAWIEEFEGKNTKKVDSKVYDNEIAKLAGELRALENDLSNKLLKRPLYQGADLRVEHGTYTVVLGAAYGDMKTSFFVNALNGENFRQKHNTYLVISFLSADGLHTTQSALQGVELKITGTYEKARKTNQKGNLYFELNYVEVTAVSVMNHPIEAELEQLQKDRSELERKDWIAPLTRDELQDLNIETEVAKKRISVYQTLTQNLAGFLDGVPKLQRRLQKLALFFKTYKVQVRETCPNSMVFIQNPAYVGAKSHFKQISSLSGLDESLLNALMRIDEIGLVNVANLYEKWCLLQIIKVLNQVYRFEISSGWQSLLTKAVLNESKDIEIQLSAPERQQRIILTYEKTLESGKRPDFVIDLYSNNYRLDESRKWVISGEYKKRLVLDAKFRGNVSETVINELVSGLYSEKNYSENEQNQVFIIHSSQHSIDSRTSPLSWGMHCNYGQSNGALHQFGSIFVSPTLKYGRTLEHLQRLTGMFLQGNSTILMQEGAYAPDWHNTVCIGCGNDNHETLNISFKPTKAGSERWVIECDECRLRTIKTICRACHKELYKNGSKWTYHRTRAVQTSNVVCPKCETFL